MTTVAQILVLSIQLMIDGISTELQEDHWGGLPGEAAQGARRGREVDAVGHRGSGGV